MKMDKFKIIRSKSFELEKEKYDENNHLAHQELSSFTESFSPQSKKKPNFSPSAIIESV